MCAVREPVALNLSSKALQEVVDVFLSQICQWRRPTSFACDCRMVEYILVPASRQLGDSLHARTRT